MGPDQSNVNRAPGCRFTDPASSIARANIARTCTQCHAEIEMVHRKVIKGALWEKEAHVLPACVDCHQPHKIRKVFYTQGMADADCLKCHGQKEAKAADGRSLFVNAAEVQASRHAKVACSQCHSGVNASRARACETITQKVDCGSCHTELAQQFAGTQLRQQAGNGIDEVRLILRAEWTRTPESGARHQQRRRQGGGSVIVNGVRYNVDNTTFTDAHGRTLGGLAAGMVVKVTAGMIDDNPTSPNGVATKLEVIRLADGPADDNSVSFDNNSFRVMGQTVFVGLTTVFDNVADLFAIDDLVRQGKRPEVEIHGSTDDNGSLRASFVHLWSDDLVPGRDIQLKATVRNLNRVDTSFAVGPLLQKVDYGGATTTLDRSS